MDTDHSLRCGNCTQIVRMKGKLLVIKTQYCFVIDLTCKCLFIEFLGVREQSVSQDHYVTGYTQCLQQIHLATNQCRMDVHLKSRLLHHLSRNQNVRMIPCTKQSARDNYVSSPVSPVHIHSSLYRTTSPVSSRSCSTSPVHRSCSQLYINTISPPQDLSGSSSHSSELAPVGLLERAPCLQVPGNPHHQRQIGRAVHVVDENNNIMNPLVPAPVSGPVWRPW